MVYSFRGSTPLFTRNPYKPIFLVLGLIFIVVLVFPHTPHSTGSDSLVIQELSRSIIRFGEAKWVRNPLSFFGLSSYSYPSALMYTTAELMLLTGLGVEAATVLWSVFLIILCFFGMYLLSSFFSDSFFFRFFSSFFLATSPLILRWSTFSLSSRLLFIAIFIYSLYFMMRFLENPGKSLFLLMLVYLVFLGFSHRMYLIAYPALLICFVVSVVFLALRSRHFFLSRHSTVIVISIFCFLVFLSVWGGLWRAPNARVYSTYPNPLYRLFFILFAYARNTGVASFFFPIGLLAFSKQRSHSIFFTSFLMMVLAPFFASWQYLIVVFLPLFILVSTYSFMYLVDNFGFVGRSFFVLVLVLSICFSIFGQFFYYQSWSSGVGRHVTSDTFSLIHFINTKLDGKIFSLALDTRKVSYLSDRPVLYSSEVVFFVYDLVDRKNFSESFYFDYTGRRFLVPEQEYSGIWVFENTDPTDKSQVKTLNDFNVNYLLSSCDSALRLPLESGAHESCNRIYDNNGHLLYYLSDCG